MMNKKFVLFSEFRFLMFVWVVMVMTVFICFPFSCGIQPHFCNILSILDSHPSFLSSPEDDRQWADVYHFCIPFFVQLLLITVLDMLLVIRFHLQNL